ncbi:MAG TPA: ATP-binding protein [Gemmatimonadales bacterium]|nr:ATP-binding protein [Gemmatimonadales bacterium]
MSHRSRWWSAAVAAVVAAGAEWLHAPAAPWVAGLGLGAAAAYWALRPLESWGRRAVVGLALLLAASAAAVQLELHQIEHDWPDRRQRGLAADSARVAKELRATLERADRLVRVAALASEGSRAAAFETLTRAMPGGGPELGVAILERNGVPWAWAGRHRIRPSPVGDSIDARITGYYVVLETRRHLPAGRVAVASALVWADPVVPDRARSLAERFRAQTGVGLRVYHADSAPDRPDVFDYGDAAGSRTLFSVQPLPPEQGEARALALRRGSGAVAWATVLLVVAGLVAAGRPVERYALLLVLLYTAIRSPIGHALGLGSFFSPATFYRPVLGPLSSSVGVLVLTGALATLAAVSLWRLRPPRHWAGVLAGAGLLFTAPYLVREVGRGITPPADGVPTGLWLTWQLALALTVAAVIVLAAALFRGRSPAPERVWPGWVGAGIALAATVIGLFIWSPRGGWPNWYTFLWTPALVLVTLPTRRRFAVIGIALVTGSAAALVTWGAVLEGRRDVAARDVARLGNEPDPLAVALLERFGAQIADARPPTTPTELYALWRRSAIGAEDYPARLAVWGTDARPRVELSLDSLDLPTPLVSALVAGLDSTRERSVATLQRVPGIHYLLLRRLGPGAVLTAAVGPRSELVAPDRLSRLLEGEPDGSALYEIALSPPGAGETRVEGPSRWRREGWSIRLDRALALPGGVRHVHATIDLRGPVPVLVRGALVVLLDVAVLAALWFLAEGLAGERAARLRWRRAARSFRIRLAVALAMFFVVPAAGFAGWSFARLDDEAERGRDFLVSQTLRDAILSAGSLLQAPGAQVDDGLGELSRRINADLALYSGGVLAGSSSPILEDLGVVPPFADPVAFQTLALGDELEVTRDGPGRELPLRVGYRVVRLGPPGGIGILATPQPSDGGLMAEEQLDLAYVLLLATLLGGGAALAAAQLAARALSRPVAELRRSALELGRGHPMPEPSATPPVEFEPVFAAFERMAADIRTSQAALEEARRRTATVLATVATGVVALDAAGKVLIANPRAAELMGTALPEGERFDARLGPEWQGVKDAVGRYLEAGGAAEAVQEIEVQGRRVRLQFATLGAGLGGIVLAVDDLTDVTQAERVLAWGEMARQVAHEIKNPLTPVRLGIQHLRRAYRDRRPGFDRTLEDTAERILGEIDRLDTIARAFSRFAAPTSEQLPLDAVDLGATAREVVELYRLGNEGADLRLEVEGAAVGLARKDEVKEVLVNLLENARNAGAGRVVITAGPGRFAVSDDGCGIPAEQLPRIFEPRFSTTTSGSGLGLAIVRRLVESWGGRIEVESEVGRGTRVGVTLRVPEPPPDGRASGT